MPPPTAARRGGGTTPPPQTQDHERGPPPDTGGTRIPIPLDQAETVQQDRSTPDLPVLYASILGKQGSRFDTDRRNCACARPAAAGQHYLVMPSWRDWLLMA